MADKTPPSPGTGGRHWAPRLLRWVLLALPAAAYTTMVLGAYVKAVGGGMSCPQWPTCMDGNYLVPLTDERIASEIVHRIAASIVVVAGAILLGLVLTRYSDATRLRLFTFLAATVLAVQVILGGLTVITNLQPLVVTSHLALATLFFALTLFIWFEGRKLLGPPPRAAASAADEAQSSRESLSANSP